MQCYSAPSSLPVLGLCDHPSLCVSVPSEAVFPQKPVTSLPCQLYTCQERRCNVVSTGDPCYICIMTPSSLSSFRHHIIANIYWVLTVYKAFSKCSKYAVFSDLCNNSGKYYFLYRWGNWGLQKLICSQFPVTWDEVWTYIMPMVFCIFVDVYWPYTVVPSVIFNTGRS